MNTLPVDLLKIIRDYKSQIEHLKKNLIKPSCHIQKQAQFCNNYAILKAKDQINLI